MENALKGLLIAVGVIITCAVISIGFYFYHGSEDASSAAAENLNNFTTEITESKLTMYDGLEVSGSDVINCIKKNLGGYTSSESAPVSISVTTTVTNTYTNSTYITNIQNFTDGKYINPVGKFTGSIVRNANGVIVMLRFTQH